MTEEKMTEQNKFVSTKSLSEAAAERAWQLHKNFSEYIRDLIAADLAKSETTITPAPQG